MYHKQTAKIKCIIAYTIGNINPSFTNYIHCDKHFINLMSGRSIKRDLAMGLDMS